MGSEDYILSTDRHNFNTMGLQESRHGTDHIMIPEVLQREGALLNRHYRRGQTRWKIHLRAARPHTKGEASFLEIKEAVNRTLHPKKTRTSWISQETWWISNRRVALQKEQRDSTQEVRQVRLKFQIYLRGNRQQWVSEAGESIEKFLA